MMSSKLTLFSTIFSSTNNPSCNLLTEDGHSMDEEQEMCTQEVAIDQVDAAVNQNEALIEPEASPADCLPECMYEKFPWCAATGTPFWDRWSNIRLKSYRLIEHKYFETFIIVMILLSSLALVRTLAAWDISSSLNFFKDRD